jgi:hypothetical protein
MSSLEKYLKKKKIHNLEYIHIIKILMKKLFTLHLLFNTKTFFNTKSLFSHVCRVRILLFLYFECRKVCFSFGKLECIVFFSLNTCKKFTKLLQTLKRDAHYWSGPRENRQSKNLFFFFNFRCPFGFFF